MQIIQHTQSMIQTTVPKANLSDNLMSLLNDVSKYHSFDSAHIYHLTHHNVVEYKHIILQSMSENLRKIQNIAPKEKSQDIIGDVNEYFTDVVEPQLPISMIVFEHNYLSVNESFMLFFKEHGNIILVDKQVSTLALPNTHYVLQSLMLDERLYAPVAQGLAYESSTTHGLFPFVSFLLPFDKDASIIDLYQRERPYKKLELQVRTLGMGQDKSANINIPKNLDVAKHYDHKCIFNTRLIYNGEIIFSEYDIALNNPREIVEAHLTPFVDNMKSRYEIMDNVPVALTKEYYDHFKANIKPVIEMIKC